MKVRWVLLAVLTGLLSGCATAAQREAQTIGSRLKATQVQMDACLAPINSDPAYGDVARHFPLKNLSQATLAQQTDPTFATPHEVELLSARHDRQVQCRSAFINGYMVAPTLALVWEDAFAKADANLVDLAKGHLTWGEYVMRNKAMADESHAKLIAADQRLTAELNARSQQEMAQRAAAAQAFSSAMYQQQLLNQNQQLINNANRPVTTNCNRFGNSVNCTTY